MTETNCFGCAPANPIGLRLVFEEEGEGYSTTVRLGPNYESFPGIVHGGIVATVLDEILAQAVYRKNEVSAVTTALRVRYGRPMRTETDHRVYAEIKSTDEVGTIRVSGRITSADGDLVAAGDGTFYLLTDEVLTRAGHLPEAMTNAVLAAQRS